MQAVICQAIREKLLLELHYDGQSRRVAPHIYGIDSAGDELLSCYQVWGDGARAGWLALRLAGVPPLQVTPQTLPARAQGVSRASRNCSSRPTASRRGQSTSAARSSSRASSVRCRSVQQKLPPF